MSNELMVKDELVAALDKAAESGLLAFTETSKFKQAFMVASAINELKAILTPEVMKPFMALQNTSLGFKTDKANGGYPLDTVRECIITATLNGVHCVNNEFNIISGQCYITKNGFGHKLKDIQMNGWKSGNREIKGFGWTEIPGVPTMHNGGAIIKYQLEWTVNGKSYERELTLAIRVNSGMGADAIIGKACRKARAWLYSTITGMELGEGDVDDIEVVDTTVTEKVKSPFEQQSVEEQAEEQDQLPM
jgi:hypothetical protein